MSGTTISSRSFKSSGSTSIPGATSVMRDPESRASSTEILCLASVLSSPLEDVLLFELKLFWGLLGSGAAASALSELMSFFFKADLNLRRSVILFWSSTMVFPIKEEVASVILFTSCQPSSFARPVSFCPVAASQKSSHSSRRQSIFLRISVSSSVSFLMVPVVSPPIVVLEEVTKPVCLWRLEFCAGFLDVRRSKRSCSRAISSSSSVRS